MKKSILRRKNLSLIICIAVLGFLLFLFSMPVYAEGKRSNANQWKRVGGKIVASGTHDFTTFWYSAGRYQVAADGMFWKDNENKEIAATHTSEEVNKNVLIKKGQITVQGPGFLASFIRTKKGFTGAKLAFPNGGKEFHPASLGKQELLKGNDGKWKWYDNNINDFDPSKNNGGWIPAGEKITLEVWAYNVYTDGGIWWRGYAAPKGVEYEFWFFPREGGKIISMGPVNDINEINNDMDGPNIGEITSGKIYDETSGKWLNPGDPVYYDHYLTTNGTDPATITFNNDNGQVYVRPNSKIIPKKVIKKTKSNGFFVAFGRLFSLFKGKKQNGYAVETFNSVLGVEGTEFETAYDPATGVTTLKVVEGIVNFSCKNTTAAPMKVRAGMSATIDNECIPKVITQAFENELPSNVDETKINPIADNHVYAYSYSGWNKANWGKYNVLGAGWHPDGGEKRAYLKFNLSGINPSTFEKATLRLYHYHTGGSNAVDLGVYRVMSPWIEGRGTYKPATPALPGELTWMNQPSIDRYPVVYFNPGSNVNKWVEVDIASLVKAWLTGVPNHGMVIKVGENLSGKPQSQYGFHSREDVDLDKHPHIVLSGSGGMQEPVGKLPEVGQNNFHIGSVWQIVESCGETKWMGTWTRRPGTETFDATWKQVSGAQSGQVARDVIDFKGIDDGIVTLYRHGTKGTYTGKISSDGQNIRNGDASWYNNNCNWTAQLNQTDVR